MKRVLLIVAMVFTVITMNGCGPTECTENYLNEVYTSFKTKYPESAATKGSFILSTDTTIEELKDIVAEEYVSFTYVNDETMSMNLLVDGEGDYMDWHITLAEYLIENEIVAGNDIYLVTDGCGESHIWLVIVVQGIEYAVDIDSVVPSTEHYGYTYKEKIGLGIERHIQG